MSKDRTRQRAGAKTARAAARPPAYSLDDMPRWVPVALYAFVTLVLFRDFILAGAKLLGTDTLALSYFARSFYTNFVHAFHRFPLWDPLLYGGLPFIDGMHGDIFYPPSLALFFLNAERMWGWKLILHVFFAGVFCYLWLRELGISRGAAMLGGLVFMLGADLVSLVYPGGDGKLFVSALAPLMFLLTERAARLRRLRDYAAFSLGLALVMFTSHMQAAYFTVWGVTLYFIFRVVQQRKPIHIAAFAVAGVIGVGAAAIQFIPPLDYLRNWSHRASKTEQAAVTDAYQYSTSYSLHPEEIMSLAVPEFVGDNVQTETKSGLTYWGKNGFKLNSEYAGLIGLLLLPLLFIRRRTAQTWFFVGLATLALLYALGADTPLFRLFYLIPGVKLFRAPSIIIFLYGLSIATLAALALDRLMELPNAGVDAVKKASRALWIGTAVLGLLALLATAGVLMSVWQAIFYRDLSGQAAQMLANNAGPMKTGFWLAFFLAAAIAGAIEGWLRGIWSARTALIALCVISFFDLYRAGRPFVRGTALMNDAGDPTVFAPDESIDFLRQRQAAGEVFRAFDLANIVPELRGQGYPSNVFALHGVEQMAGHHGNEIGRYRELLGGDQPLNLGKNFSLFDLTNTMYVTSPQPIELPGYTEVFRGSRSIVYRKADVLPRAYLVGQVEVVPGNAAVERMLAQGFDYRKTAILAEPLPGTIAIQADPQGSVEWVKREVDAHTLRITTDKPALLVVLDNYYKAWTAQVDGKSVPIVRANHVFRGVPVAAGQHEVTFTYDTGYLRGAALTSAVILLLLMLVAFGSPLLDRVRARSAAA